jgi:hypothetical protein
MHRRQFTRPVQPRQLDRIAAVGLDPLGAPLWRLGGRHHPTVNFQLLETPRQNKAAGAGFVTDFQLLLRMAQFAQRFFNRVKVA